MANWTLIFGNYNLGENRFESVTQQVRDFETTVDSIWAFNNPAIDPGVVASNLIHFQMRVDDGGTYYGVLSDPNIVYLGMNFSVGIRTYTYDDDGNLTLADSNVGTGGGSQDGLSKEGLRIQHDDTFWEAFTPGGMTWNGSAWLNNGDPRLSPVGTWASNFRPQSVRVEYTGTGDFNLRIYDGSPFPIVNANNYVSGTEVTINFSAADIFAIQFQGAAGDIQITKIEFRPSLLISCALSGIKAWQVDGQGNITFLNYFRKYQFDGNLNATYIPSGQDPHDPWKLVYAIDNFRNIVSFRVHEIDGRFQWLGESGGSVDFDGGQWIDGDNDIVIGCGQDPYGVRSYETLITPAGTYPISYPSDGFNKFNGQRPDVHKWRLYDDSDRMSISSNRLVHANSPNGVGTGSDVRSQWYFDGDFDVQTDATITLGPNTDGWVIGMLCQSWYWDGTKNETWEIALGYQSGARAIRVKSNKDSLSFWPPFATWNTSNSSIKVRITRVGDQLTFYYDNGGWVQLYTISRPAWGQYTQIFLRQSTFNANPSAGGYHDNFIVNSGDILWPPCAFADDFDASDGTPPNPNIWTIDQGGDTPDTTNVILNDGTESTGKLRQLSYNGSGMSRVDTVYKLDRSFDVVVFYDGTPSSTEGWVFALQADIDNDNRFEMRWQWRNASPWHQWSARSYIGGSLVSNTNTADVKTAAALRIQRTGAGEIRMYGLDTDSNGTWRQLQSRAGFPTGPVTIRLRADSWASNPVVPINWNDFHVRWSHNPYIGFQFVDPGTGSRLGFVSPVDAIDTAVSPGFNKVQVEKDFESTPITQVEIRAYVRTIYLAPGPEPLGFDLRPVFNGAIDGNNYDILTSGITAAAFQWTPYFDITNDPAAPGTWTASDVANLDVDVDFKHNPAAGPGDFVNCSLVEIRINGTDTYYFDSYNVGEAWGSNPANMVDGSTANTATASFSDQVQNLIGNTFQPSGPRVFAAGYTDGVKTYQHFGGNFSARDTKTPWGNARGLWFDKLNNWLFVTSRTVGGDGLTRYAVDAQGNLTYETNRVPDEGVSLVRDCHGVERDDDEYKSHIFVTAESGGLLSYRAKNGTEPPWTPVSGWNQILDDTFWDWNPAGGWTPPSLVGGGWNGSSWDSGSWAGVWEAIFLGVRLDGDKAGWEAGWRPSFLIITHTAPSADRCMLYDAGVPIHFAPTYNKVCPASPQPADDVIACQHPYPSGGFLNCTFEGAGTDDDIWRLVVWHEAAVPFQITDIQFFQS